MAKAGDPRVALCIVTLNPGRFAARLAAAVASQTLRPDPFLVIDSSSTDGSLDLFRDAGANVIVIPRERFDHGGTRDLAMDATDAGTLIYMTQDAIPMADTAFHSLVDGLLADDRIGLAYGRQVARPADPAHVHAHRSFNYPDQPSIRTADDVPRLGVRAAFSSNSFAAYRRTALEEIGRFPERIIGSEDLWAAARLLKEGWRVAYVPAACVEHAHDYRVPELFRRYFDIGVFHTTQPWFEEFLGSPQREGMGLVRRQLKELRDNGAGMAPLRHLVRAGASWAGFRAGRLHGGLPRGLSRRLSMNPAYWSRGRRSVGSGDA
jgi:polysaccharide biosynthesis protein PslC